MIVGDAQPSSFLGRSLTVASSFGMADLRTPDRAFARSDRRHVGPAVAAMHRKQKLPRHRQSSPARKRTRKRRFRGTAPSQLYLPDAQHAAKVARLETYRSIVSGFKDSDCVDPARVRGLSGSG